MIHKTRWSPDTCECVLDQVFDDEIVPGEMTFTGVEVVELDTIHRGKPDAGGLVLEENRRKNRAVGVLSEIGIEAAWVFDNNRDIMLTVSAVDHGRAVAALAAAGIPRVRVCI